MSDDRFTCILQLDNGTIETVVVFGTDDAEHAAKSATFQRGGEARVVRCFVTREILHTLTTATRAQKV